MTQAVPGNIQSSGEETDRLAALRSYSVLDTGPDAALDAIVRAAALVCHAPLSALNFVDAERHWTKAGIGIPVPEVPKEVSVCANVIGDGDLVVIRDLHQDLRFCENPYVCGGPHLRFYAGAILKTENGLPIGTLCVVDREPRPEGLTEAQSETLRTLAQAVMSHLELRRTSRIAHEREQRLSTVIDAIPQKLWTVRPDGTNGYFNRRWCDFTGAKPGETDGSGWLDFVHPDDRERVTAQRLQAFQAGEDYQIEYRLRHHSGEYRWVLVRAQALRNSQGEIDVWYGTTTTIHRTRMAELARSESEQRYRALIDASTDAIWVADANGQITQGWGWDEMSEDHPNSYLGHGWLQALHPEEQSGILMRWRRTQMSGEPYEMEFRIRRCEGQYRWTSIRAVPIRNPDGSVQEWIGTATDIHERKMAEEELRTSLGRLRLALQAGRMVSWELNTETDNLTCSINSVDLLGVASGPLEDLLAKVHTEDRDRVRAFIQSAPDPGNDALEFRFVLPSGDMAWLELRTEQVSPTRFVGIMFDITDRKENEEEVRWAAHHDALTGLPNRRAFEEVFEQEWRQAIRSGEPLSVLFVDADCFKQYNDRYGHAAGDDLLRTIGRTLEAQFRRPRDIAARYGGEEFVILLPDTDAAGALQRAEAMRKAVQALGVPHSEERGGIATVSIGVATVHATHGGDRLGFLEAADAALYEAKAAGRNCVRVSEKLFAQPRATTRG